VFSCVVFGGVGGVFFLVGCSPGWRFVTSVDPWFLVGFVGVLGLPVFGF
jgi:hypothetical protein